MILYANAQQRLMYTILLAKSMRLNKKTILHRSSLSTITSDAIKLSSDLAFMETPTAASFNDNTSFNPSPIIITSRFYI
jgi:hypothetical protein